MEDVRRILDAQQLRNSSCLTTDVDLYFQLTTAAHKKPPNNNEETKEAGGEKSVLFLEKCKAIGKVGPLVCRMNFRDSVGSWYTEGTSPQPLDGKCIDITCRCPFGTVMANTCVFSGAWYYEVLLLTNGIMQIGWVLSH